MKVQQMVLVSKRRPGYVVVKALGKVLTLKELQKKWAMDIDEETSKILVHCFNHKGHKAEVVPGVQIKLLEPVFPDAMFNHLTFELVVEGIINMLSVKKINEDFRRIKNEFKKEFEQCTGSYRVFEQQERN